MKVNKIKVKTPNNEYPIIIGKNLINKLQTIFKDNSINFTKSLFVIDKKVPKKFTRQIFSSIKFKKEIFFFDSSEINKNQKNVDNILKILLLKNFHRNDCIISIGGGITGDITGYAASIFKRGINFINIPTTLLSQVDSCIGGKTGINTKYGKNLIGSFYQPSLVLSDINFLTTLPKREMICGYAEILKHSIIKDKKFFLFLKKNVKEILNAESPFIENAIRQSCVIKKKIIEKDEKEKNYRKILNFGHTFGHAFEATQKFSKKLNHGEAVMLGISCAIKFAKENKILNNENFQLINNHLLENNFPQNINKYFLKKNINKILFYMSMDKKNKNKKINIILIKRIDNANYSYFFHYKKLRSFFRKILIN